VVRADSPHRTLADFFEASKRAPGRMTYSTRGIATSNHIAMEDLLHRVGAEMMHVPFRGAQEGVTALLGRQIDMVADAQAWRPQVEAGEFRLLSVWTRDRLAGFPSAPTLRELGHDMVVTSPYGVAGPKGMAPDVVDILHRSFKKAWEDEAAQAIVRRWDMPREYLGPRDYLAFVTERVAYEREWVARLNLSID
jgi:tripartite-type tricarboxylate transporter receptor subunit TctC